MKDTEVYKICEKYNIEVIHYLGGEFKDLGFYRDEPYKHFCRIGTFNGSVRRAECYVYEKIKLKHEKFVGCSDTKIYCDDLEMFEKCLQNISAQRKKLLVNLKIKDINKDFKK